MTNGIYGYWDGENGYVAYIGLDSNIGDDKRHKQHNYSSNYGGQVINRILQYNPKRYTYFKLAEGNFSREELNEMEREAIAIFKTFKYDYPERSVFNFTIGGGGGFNVGEENPSYRHDLDDDVLIDEFLNQGLNCNEIARRHNAGKSTIRRRLKKNGVYTTPRNHKTSFYRVYKYKSHTCNQGFIFVYRYQENGKHKAISSIDLEKLEVKVKEKGLPWKKL